LGDSEREGIALLKMEERGHNENVALLGRGLWTVERKLCIIRSRRAEEAAP
jgi:hypothetical protein